MFPLRLDGATGSMSQQRLASMDLLLDREVRGSKAFYHWDTPAFGETWVQLPVGPLILLMWRSRKFDHLLYRRFISISHIVRLYEKWNAKVIFDAVMAWQYFAVEGNGPILPVINSSSLHGILPADCASISAGAKASDLKNFQACSFAIPHSDQANITG